MRFPFYFNPELADIDRASLTICTKFLGVLDKVFAALRNFALLFDICYVDASADENPESLSANVAASSIIGKNS